MKKPLMNIVLKKDFDMKSDEKREGRINTLHQRALNKRYTSNGKFHFDKLLDDARNMGVAEITAQSYGQAVLLRLKKGGHLK